MALGLKPLSNVTLAMLYILYSPGRFPLGLEYHLGIPKTFPEKCDSKRHLLELSWPI